MMFRDFFSGPKEQSCSSYIIDVSSFRIDSKDADQVQFRLRQDEIDDDWVLLDSTTLPRNHDNRMPERMKIAAAKKADVEKTSDITIESDGEQSDKDWEIVLTVQELQRSFSSTLQLESSYISTGHRFPRPRTIEHWPPSLDCAPATRRL